MAAKRIVTGVRFVSLGVLALAIIVAFPAASWLADRSKVRPPARSSRSVVEVAARADRLLKQGRTVEALKLIRAAESDQPRSAELLLVKGLALVSTGESEAARRALLQSLSNRRDQPMAAKVLAAIAFSRGEEQRGLDYLAMAANLDPGDFRPLYAAGELHLRMGRMDAAIRGFDAALQRDPDHLDSRVGRLTAMLAIRPPEQSSEWVDKLLRDAPANPRVLSLAARHAWALGDAEAALRFASATIELDPDNVDAIVIRARIRFRGGDRASALTDATRATKLDPRNTPALTILSQVQAALGDVQHSRATLSRRLEVIAETERIRELTDQIASRPDDPSPRWQLGLVAASTGARELATESYRAALVLDRTCRQAIEGLRALGHRVPYPDDSRTR